MGVPLNFVTRLNPHTPQWHGTPVAGTDSLLGTFMHVLIEPLQQLFRVTVISTFYSSGNWDSEKFICLSSQSGKSDGGPWLQRQCLDTFGGPHPSVSQSQPVEIEKIHTWKKSPLTRGRPRMEHPWFFESV